MDERQRPRRLNLNRRRLAGGDAEAEDEVIGANFENAAAMSMMILSTDILGRHRRNASKSSSVDDSENGIDDANDGDGTSSSSSSSVCSADSSDNENEHHNDKNNNGNGLSDYERLRLRNIERNQKRLASLGLLRDDENHSTTKKKKNATAESAASSSSRKRKGSSLAPPPPPRRSLPRRHCSKHRHDNECSYDDDDDDSSSSSSSLMPSPIPITRTLRPQSHQRILNEHNIKEYMRTRRIRRGRPRREEYEYKCEENCATCGGGWIFDNQKRNDVRNVNDHDGNDCPSDDDDSNDEIEERTRLIRCKDCRGAFHLECMLIHGKENCECGVEEFVDNDVGEDARITEIDEPPTKMTRDPKRCYQCEVKRRGEGQLDQKENHRSLTTVTDYVLSPLQATIENRNVVVRVSVENLLLANVKGRYIACIVTLHGRDNSNDGENGMASNGSSPCTEVHEIQQLISKALSNSASARIQANSCTSLRKYTTTEVSTSTVAQLGGIRVLLNSLCNHIDRPNIQAEAICTLSEIHRVCPQLVEVEMIRRGGCVDLAILSMERHPSHTKLQLMSCRMFRTLAHDAKCCSKLKSKKAVLSVVNSIRRNPRKRDLMVEGCMFLQTIMTFLTEPTVHSLLRLRMNSRNNDDFPGLIPTLVTSIKTNKKDLNHVSTLLDVLSNVALTTKGSTLLRSLDIDSLVIEMIQEHFDIPYLHEMSFAIICNVLIADGCGTTAIQRSRDLINIALKSAMKYPRNEVIQENVCRLLVTLTSEYDGEAQRLVQGKRSRRILTLASENFPDSCQDFVHTLLHNNK